MSKIDALAACAVYFFTLLVAGCASVDEQAKRPTPLTAADLAIIKASFREQGQAKLDRLDQDDAQKSCSIPPSAAVPKEVAERIEKANLAAIRYPSDGTMLGDWRRGEAIAQSGVGKQFSDNPKNASGGNCYACHQMTKAEISYGTIGPSLFNYGKIRGNSPEMQRYTFGRIFNPQAYTACSNMPRFGHNAILTEQQIKDVTALLLDPNSPVNQ